MQKRIVLVLLIGAVIVGCVLFARSRYREHSTLKRAATTSTTRSVNSASSKTASDTGKYAQIDTRSLSKEGIAEEVRRRDAEDPKWEWKTPIRFYGRVIDENQRSVADATVHFQWNDLSPRGTSDSQSTSDAQGLFSLADVNGKGVSVRVSKEGYYTSIETNRISYEFANPYEESYYLPNPDEPVTFRLRRKGDAQQLVAKTTKTMIPYGDGNSARIDLFSGSESSVGQLVLTVSKPDRRGIHFPYDWRISIAILNGGLREHAEEFAFEAPADGYQPSIDYSSHAENGTKGVALEKKLYFAFDQPKRYGRLSLRTDGNSRYVFIDYVLNPSGSRNLENGPPSSSSPR